MISKIFYEQKTPCHIIDIDKIRDNIRTLQLIKRKTNIKLLFTIKGFSNDVIIPLFIDEFDGVSSSGLWEARLAKERFNKPVHTYSSAFKDCDYPHIIQYSDYIIYNSINQLNYFYDYSKNKKLGIRINPEYSTVKRKSVDPCQQYSRFGVTIDNLEKIRMEKISGLHFHTMCGQYSLTLANTLDVVGEKFDYYLSRVCWVNIGGGQLFTAYDYNVNEAINAINNFKNRYDIEVFAEPCETVVLDSGYTVASVIDIVHNGMDSVILDLSAICHLPDIVNAPYRCAIYNADYPQKKPFTYRICGCTCYAGDIFGDYSFDYPLQVGDKVIFIDTASYSMVKTNYFNGITPPDYLVFEHPEKITVAKEYGYNTFLSVL